MTTINDARANMASLALDAVGAHAPLSLSAATQPRGTDYLDLIAPGETPAMAAQMAKMSGCGLVVRGLWRKFGFQDPELCGRYVVGAAVELIAKLARQATAGVAPPCPAHTAATLRAAGVQLDHNDPAWVPDVFDPHAWDGDVFLLEGPEHVATVVGVVCPEAPTTLELLVDSVDGGQVGSFGQFIARRRRELVQRSGGLVPTLDGRPVVGWFSFEALFNAYCPPS